MGLLRDYEPFDGPSFESLVCIPGGICGVLRSIKPCFVMQLDSVHQVARCASSYQLGRLRVRHEKQQTVCTGECLNQSCTGQLQYNGGRTFTDSKHGKNVKQRDTWNQNAPSTMYMILITVGLVCGMALLTFENVDQHHIFNKSCCRSLTYAMTHSSSLTS